MDFREIREYIERVKNSEKFKKLDEFTCMTSIRDNQDIYENIKYYLSMYHYRRDCKEFFQPDYDNFVRFLESYFNDKPEGLSYDEKGRIDLRKTLHVIRPTRFCNNGFSIDNSIMFPDGNIYFCKIPLVCIGRSNVRNSYCLYSALIASQIAKKLQVEAADITLGSAAGDGWPRILSKNFLQPGQELITYAEDKEQLSISEQMRLLEKTLKLRRFPEQEIEQTKSEFLKQEFIAKLIGLRDQTAENSPIIIETDEEGNKHVKMAPMYDLDFSFHIGQENNDVLTRKCDNGKDDIVSLIEQYKHDPKFSKFVISCIQDLNMEEIFQQIYESKGLIEFKDYKSNQQMMNFINYVDKNVRISERCYFKNIWK